METEKQKILLVDDDQGFTGLMSTYLSEHGFTVEIASDAAGFKAKALEQKPDLIVLDIMLGDDNGPLVYEDIVLAGLDPQIPVIFLSGLLEDRPASAAAPGRTQVLHAKPIKIKKLLQEIQTLLN